MLPENESTFSNSITWARLQPGYKIINLSPRYYNEVVNLIKNHYFSSDVITKCTRLAEDETSSNSFLQHAINILQDDRSIILVQEPTHEVIGALLLNVITKADFGRTYTRYNLHNGEAYNKYIEIKNALNKKADIFLDFKCGFFVRFYLLCINEEYLNTNFGYYLLRCGIDVCRALHVPIACGVFPNEEFQKCAELVGFKLTHKIRYSDWLDKEGGVIFDDPDMENTACALMVATVPAPAVIPYHIAETATIASKKDTGSKDKRKSK